MKPFAYALGSMAAGGPVHKQADALAIFAHCVIPASLIMQPRPPTKSELNATSVLALPLDEVSAKVRIGSSTEDEERDKSLPIWAGKTC